MMNPNCQTAAGQALLMQVDQAGFAVVDANLYLDTHPCDGAALDYYKIGRASCRERVYATV